MFHTEKTKMMMISIFMAMLFTINTSAQVRPVMMNRYYFTDAYNHIGDIIDVIEYPANYFLQVYKEMDYIKSPNYNYIIHPYIAEIEYVVNGETLNLICYHFLDDDMYRYAYTIIYSAMNSSNGKWYNADMTISYRVFSNTYGGFLIISRDSADISKQVDSLLTVKTTANFNSINKLLSHE